MEFIKAAIYGMTQGLTEFLPVSSSGHLAVLHRLFIFQPENELAFDVLLHLATLLAVIFYFRRDIIIIIKDCLGSFKPGHDPAKGRLGWLIIAGTIPAVVFGLLFEGRIEGIAKNDSALLIIAFMLVFIGIIFILVEKYAEKTKGLKDIGFKGAVFIGLAQALALIPGTSRSGATIIAGMKLGFKREEAIRFSFLLSVPIILGASLKKIPSLFSGSQAPDSLLVMGIAFIFAFASGFFAIHYLLSFAKKYKLNIFAYYRFILALVLIVLFFWK